MPESIRLLGIKFYANRFPLLRGIAVHVAEGECVVIAGRSGAGKSTLLEIAAWLTAPDSGTVLWGGVDVSCLTREQLLDSRADMGYMFQKPALISNHTVADNIALPLRYHHDMTEREIDGRRRAIMEECGLFNLEHAFPEALSSGQARSASLARALVVEPRLLFLDEPTAGVDAATENGLLSVLRDYRGRRRVSILATTNTPQALRGIADRVLVLDAGTLSEPGSAAGHAEEPPVPIAMGGKYA